MIVDEELTVSRRRKADIVQELRKLQFRPFPKVAKAKAAGETEDVVEEEEENEDGGAIGNLTDYDYLLGMAIWSLTQEKVRFLGQSTTYADLTNMLWGRRSRSSGSRPRTKSWSCWRCSLLLRFRSGRPISKVSLSSGR